MKKTLATLTVIGRDKIGVVARITQFLFEQGGNIEALEEQVTRSQFSMTVQASWKAGRCEEPTIRAGLTELGRELGMEIRLRMQGVAGRRRVALLATKEPHCLERLLSEWGRGRLKADVCLVVSNHADLKPLADRAGVPFHRVDWEDRRRAEDEVVGLLDEHGVDLVVLARFMKILSPDFVWRFKNKIINIHPSLLPSFPGPQAYRQAYEHGVKITGVTAHFVSMHLDEGPIIAQGAFPLKPGQSLKEIVTAGQKLESEVLLRAVRLCLAQKLDVYWGKVREV